MTPLTPMVLPLADPQADRAVLGGKGASLARLAAAGFPVPAGFHVTTQAYRAFISHNALQEPILAAVDGEPAAAAQRIARLFVRSEVPTEIAATIRAKYAALGAGSVAVRSSATAEDLPDASFAGQQDTYLDVRGGSAVVEAVRACWASLWTARAIAYRARHRIRPQDVALAVVVQRMVAAEVSGVLFTADPVTGDRDRVVVNAVAGLGESLVSGTADPQMIVLDQDGAAVIDRHGERWLDDATARDLARLGRRIERLFALPVDIEWAVHAGEIAVLQARPITVAGHEDWNDSLTGDYLWTCANLGEAIPSVMTPATWSLVQIFMSEAMSVPALGPHRICGTIGGRFYLNLSVAMGAGSALGLGGLVRRASDQAFGRIPAQVEIPRLPMSRVAVLVEIVPTVIRFLLRVAAYQRDLTARIADVPERCARSRARIQRAATPAEQRTFAERAGELTGCGQDVYLLSVQEILDVLRGDRAPLSHLPARRNTYRRYAALPPYPTLIRGRFDPLRWAADPRRRTDVYDPTRQIAPLGEAITGFPAATGVVEGRVRVLTRVDQGEQLQLGEVLVTTVTNVGWTPLFPRAAAVVTDIGAPLSHAAIVARELGIPAVVGTGNATTRLRTGDGVRVDGDHGIVDLLPVSDPAIGSPVAGSADQERTRAQAHAAPRHREAPPGTFQDSPPPGEVPNDRIEPEPPADPVQAPAQPGPRRRRGRDRLV